MHGFTFLVKYLKSTSVPKKDGELGTNITKLPFLLKVDFIIVIIFWTFNIQFIFQFVFFISNTKETLTKHELAYTSDAHDLIKVLFSLNSCYSIQNYLGSVVFSFYSTGCIVFFSFCPCPSVQKYRFINPPHWKKNYFIVS